LRTDTGGLTLEASVTSEHEEETMSSIVVCASRSHGNTRKIADAMAKVLDAPVVSPAEVDPTELASYDLVGLGSGVYAMRLDSELRELVDSLPPGEGRHVFVFATSGAPEWPWLGFTHEVRTALESKGYRLDGTFTCRGWDTWGPLACFGGLNRGRPNARDLLDAERFAAELRDHRTTRPVTTPPHQRTAT
jgi:flavodoxin